MSLIDGLASRHQDLGALPRRDDGLMSDLSPIGDLRLQVLQHDQVRYRVIKPSVDVVLVVRKPPPDLMSDLSSYAGALK